MRSDVREQRKETFNAWRTLALLVFIFDPTAAFHPSGPTLRFAVGNPIFDVICPMAFDKRSYFDHRISATSMSDGAKPDPLVMYIVLNKDLDWPTGAIINQACHVSAAVAYDAREDPDAIAYLTEVEGQMNKATLGAKSEGELKSLADKLSEAGVPHKLWIEQPEGVASALATWPRRRSQIQKLFKKFKRF
mmetsp:Transcript_133272/g.242778  ORF Transcript_133272/g.242778 Transcript_133272/m.242778 type:complete len:191 (+) Transcript_133272:144-716(+)